MNKQIPQILVKFHDQSLLGNAVTKRKKHTIITLNMLCLQSSYVGSVGVKTSHDLISRVLVLIVLLSYMYVQRV